MRFNSFRILRSKEEGKEETPQLSVKEAVEKIAKGLEDPEKEEEKEEKSLVKDPEKEKEKKDEKKDEPSKEETEKALALVAALNDPDQAKEIVELLAKKVGLTKDSTKEEKKEISKTLKEQFKAKLGEDYEFLSDVLFDAVKDVIAAEVEEKTKDVRSKVIAREEKERENATEAGYSKVESEFSNFKDVEESLSKLMDEMPPKPGQDPYTYFKRITILAAEEKGVVLKKASPTSKEKIIDIEKAKRNSKDVISQLTSERDEDVQHKTPTPIKSVKEAVAEAAKSLEASLSK